uniref:Integrase catalytic domain-containing protein n=1 Tax=Amphilophus citrinellus TaxID=61819 RepID=A0A3Q0R2N1_AMPCI
MTRDITKFCAECLPCQTRSSPTPHERAPLQPIQAERPFQKVAADITELPVTSHGNRYVLVIMDYFTRYVNFFPLKDQRATTVAKCIFEDYIRQHGLPESIHTDQGRQFESDLVKYLCNLLGIYKTRTSPYHAQSDGMVERLNRTLKDQLAKYISQCDGEWDMYLPQVELAYNSSVHSSTGFSPFFLVPGREPNLPLDVMLNCSPAVTTSTPGTPAAYPNHLATRLSHAFRNAAHNSYDKKVAFHPHQPGDLVLLDDPAQRMNKLAPRWKGPFVILQKMSTDGQPGVTYKITNPRNTCTSTCLENPCFPFFICPFLGGQVDLNVTVKSAEQCFYLLITGQCVIDNTEKWVSVQLLACEAAVAVHCGICIISGGSAIYLQAIHNSYMKSYGLESDTCGIEHYY